MSNSSSQAFEELKQALREMKTWLAAERYRRATDRAWFDWYRNKRRWALNQWARKMYRRAQRLRAAEILQELKQAQRSAQ